MIYLIQHYTFIFFSSDVSLAIRCVEEATLYCSGDKLASVTRQKEVLTSLQRGCEDFVIDAPEIIEIEAPDSPIGM